MIKLEKINLINFSNKVTKVEVLDSQEEDLVVLDFLEVESTWKTFSVEDLEEDFSSSIMEVKVKVEEDNAKSQEIKVKE